MYFSGSFWNHRILLRTWMPCSTSSTQSCSWTSLFLLTWAWRRGSCLICIQVLTWQLGVTQGHSGSNFSVPSLVTQWRHRWSSAPDPEGSLCPLRFASQQIISIHLSLLLPASPAPKSGCNTPAVPRGAHLAHARYARFHVWPSQRYKQRGFLMRSRAELMRCMFAQLALHTWSWDEAQAPAPPEHCAALPSSLPRAV